MMVALPSIMSGSIRQNGDQCQSSHEHKPSFHTLRDGHLRRPRVGPSHMRRYIFKGEPKQRQMRKYLKSEITTLMSK